MTPWKYYYNVQCKVIHGLRLISRSLMRRKGQPGATILTQVYGFPPTVNRESLNHQNRHTLYQNHTVLLWTFLSVSRRLRRTWLSLS